MSMFLDTLLTNKIDLPRSKTMYISEHSSFGSSFVSLRENRKEKKGFVVR